MKRSSSADGFCFIKNKMKDMRKEVKLLGMFCCATFKVEPTQFDSSF